MVVDLDVIMKLVVNYGFIVFLLVNLYVFIKFLRKFLMKLFKVLGVIILFIGFIIIGLLVFVFIGLKV